MKLVVDLLGADLGYSEILNGVIDSLSKTKLNFVLVGPKDLSKKILIERNVDQSRFEFIDADEYISNDDNPAISIRRKKNSSTVLGLNYLNENADGFLSAGSTGALLAGGLFITKRIGDIKRATLVTPVPNISGTTTLLTDSGAVVDSTPEMLNQFAIMATIVSKKYLKNSNPKVYLLNIGEESEKGDKKSKESFDLLKNNSRINFMGNIEARDFLSGKADVVVADGFSGNVLLKSTEGSLFLLLNEFKSIIYKNIFSKIGGLLLKTGLKRLNSKFNYKKVGAAILLGVNKPIFKAHGNSNRVAIEYAIYQAEEFMNSNIVETIKEEL